MKNSILVIMALASLLSACESEQMKERRLSQFTCEDSKIGRSQEELTAIAEACFRRGEFVKSSEKAW